MKKENAIKEIFVLTVKLFAICLVVAGLLGFINSITEPVIALNEAKEFNLSMQQLLPDAKEFEEVKDFEFSPAEPGVELESLYKGVDGENIRGYVASTVCHEGYGGDINVMVGITNEFKVSQIKIMSMSETAGLGAKAGTVDFSDQYIGLESGIGVEKNNGGSADKNTISAISGATVTSKAVTKAVNCALDAAIAGGGQNE